MDERRAILEATEAIETLFVAARRIVQAERDFRAATRPAKAGRGGRASAGDEDQASEGAADAR